MDAELKELRKFSITMFCALCVVGLLVLWRKSEGVGLALCGIGLVLLLCGGIAPRILRWPYKGWMSFAFALGFLTSHLMLLLVYYFVVAPTGIAMRMLGRDILCRKMDKKGQTYWIKRERNEGGRERYEKMF